MIKLRKAMAFFVIYNIIALFMFAFALPNYDLDTVNCYHLIRDSYFLAGILFALMIAGDWAIKEICK
jgi:nitric oxide reductase large subunit